MIEDFCPLKRITILAICLAILFLLPSHYASALVLDNSFSFKKISNQFEYFEDKTARLELSDILTDRYSTQFTRTKDDVLNFGFNDSAFWLRLELEDFSADDKHWFIKVDYPMLQYLDFYLQDENNNYQRKEMGADRPFKNRDIAHQAYIYKLPKTASGTKTLFVRVVTSSSMTLPISIETEDHFLNSIHMDNIFMGFFYGALAILFIYNLFVFLSLKDKYYLYYLVFVAGFAVFQSSYDGAANLFLWDAAYNKHIIVPAMAMTTLSSLFFTISFLNLEVQNPAAASIAKLLVVVWGGLILCIPFLEYSQIILPVVFLSVVSYMFMTTCGYIIWRNDYKPARLFLGAWLLFMVPMAVLALLRMGLIPSNEITEALYQFGFFSLMILLSLSLADRVNLLKKEKEDFAEQALFNLRKNEELIKLQNRQLERKVQERTFELRKQKDAAEDANKLKDKFVSLVAHDLKGPLSALLSYLGMLKPENEEQVEILEKVIISGQRQMDMINDVLNISRLQTGKLLPHKKNISLYLVVEVAITKNILLARNKNIHITNLIDKADMVFADEPLLVEVMDNLISNAIKFSYSGDRIEISNSKEDATKIIIKDYGIGIKESKLRKIFDLNEKTTTQGTLGEGGTGFGLPYSQEIIKAHDGTITVNSIENEGSEFIVHLPQETQASKLFH